MKGYGRDGRGGLSVARNEVERLGLDYMRKEKYRERDEQTRMSDWVAGSEDKHRRHSPPYSYKWPLVR